MTRANPIYLSKQHLRLALPRHLRELVNSGDQQSWRTAVNVLIHHHHRQAFFWSLGFREFAPPKAIATIGHAAANIAWCFIDSQVHLANLCSTPGAGRYLVRRSTHVWPTTYAALSQRFCSRSQSVRRCVAAKPKAQAEVRRAPFAFVIATNHLACTQQCRGALKLLESQ